MPLYKAYETDKQKETEGTWLEIVFGKDDECQIKVARIGGSNNAFSRLMEKLKSPHKRALQLDENSDLQDELIREGVAKGIVKGWRTRNAATGFEWKDGVQLRDGRIVPPSPEVLLEVFSDLPDVFMDIVERAMKFGLFRAAELEDDSKN